MNIFWDYISSRQDTKTTFSSTVSEFSDGYHYSESIKFLRLSSSVLVTKVFRFLHIKMAIYRK